MRQDEEMDTGDAQFELYELDLKKVRSLDGVEDMIANIERVLKRNPNDARVEVRANLMVANTLPIFDRLFNQLADQLTKVSNQIRYLPKYQIDWPAVREVASDLRHDFNRLRRLSNRCIGLAPENPRDLANRTIAEGCTWARSAITVSVSSARSSGWSST